MPVQLTDVEANFESNEEEDDDIGSDIEFEMIYDSDDD